MDAPGDHGHGEPAVAAAGAEPDGLALQDHDPPAGLQLGQADRRPEAGEAASDDDDVGLLVALQRRTLRLGEARRGSLLPPAGGCRRAHVSGRSAHGGEHRSTLRRRASMPAWYVRVARRSEPPGATATGPAASGVPVERGRRAHCHGGRDRQYSGAAGTFVNGPAWGGIPGRMSRCGGHFRVGCEVTAPRVRSGRPSPLLVAPRWAAPNAFSDEETPARPDRRLCRRRVRQLSARPPSSPPGLRHHPVRPVDRRELRQSRVRPRAGNPDARYRGG